MKTTLYVLLLIVGATLYARAQSPNDVRRLVDLRADVAEIDVSGNAAEKVGTVTFDPPLKHVPVITATVGLLKEPQEFMPVFAVVIRDVTTEGFTYIVQETDSKLRWGRGLELHWIAVVQEP